MFSFVQFSKKISYLMRQNGLTTRSLGLAVGVSNGTVAGWMRTATPRPEAAVALAQYFGIDVDTLLDDTRELPSGKHGLRVEEPPASYGRRVIAADPSFPSGARQSSQLPAQLASLSAELAAISAQLYSGEPPANLRERLRAAGEKLHRIADQH
jgi:transcriptional regulator with XRE-family HTH domain